MDYDVAIIGGGPAGYPLALCCQKYGMKVLIIEKEPHLGGVCLHMGCIPSKTLLHATEYGHVVPKELMQSKERVIGTLSQGLDMLFAAKKIDRMTGAAIVTGAHEIEVQTQQATKRVTAKTIVLATGSRPIEIPGLPFDEKRIVSSTGALHIEKVPDTLVVIGAGVIGVELASVYRRLGSKVSIIELLPTLCQGFDASIQNGLLQSLQEMGIEFFFNTKVVSAEMKKNRLCVSATTVSKPLELMADKILVAVGRRPNSQGLGLEELGIAILPSGHVQTNASFCTTVPSIYAIGDLTRGPMLAHRATAEAEALAAHLAGKKAEVDMIAVPNVIYTSPEVACCGLTEQDCVQKIAIKTGVSSLKHNGRSLASGHAEGFVKVIAERSTDRLLGVHILAHNASEMIAVASLALHMKASVFDLANLPFAHPTISEAIKEAAQKCC